MEMQYCFYINEMIIEEHSLPIYNHLFKNEVIETVIITTSSTAYTTMMTAAKKMNADPVLPFKR
ncbi:hypothetical protein [Cytobacillus gottheilii]|uniref:Uncharacterized protein n=1 Tax=Cytobacillus gottheilii TaxID=859144 RepID=A0ABX8F9N5_9BACI|nr:hypothetical protein [Cytobacillus gottheilii]QVY60820.1 hypothetical protein J1899_17830 [Cytobacillus gottheilii]